MNIAVGDGFMLGQPVALAVDHDDIVGSDFALEQAAWIHQKAPGAVRNSMLISLQQTPSATHGAPPPAGRPRDRRKGG